MRNSHYVIQSVSATCRDCGHDVDLLINDKNERAPIFYICFYCKKVVQGGVGPVSREGSVASQIDPVDQVFG
jgi:hypothetical protein